MEILGIIWDCKMKHFKTWTHSEDLSQDFYAQFSPFFSYKFPNIVSLLIKLKYYIGSNHCFSLALLAVFWLCRANQSTSGDVFLLSMSFSLDTEA